MGLKKHIPNAITCGNLFCGCLAAVLAFQGNLVWAAYLVGLGAVLDFADGLAARMLHVHSEIGKQLDSLADMITFGFVPGLVMYQLLMICVLRSTLSHFDLGNFLSGQGQDTNQAMYLLPFAGFLLTVFSAIRLAKFNVDTRQTDSFIGVPTPANTILICSLPLILDLRPALNMGSNPTLTSVLSSLSAATTDSPLATCILNPWLLIGLTCLMSLLMVAELPLFALKFKNFAWKNNALRYCFLAAAVLLLIIFRYTGIPIIILLYILLSIVNNTLNPSKNEVQG